jgi:hypothetical protein
MDAAARRQRRPPQVAATWCRQWPHCSARAAPLPPPPALVLVVGLALVAGAAAQSTKGQTLRGYTFGSDVGSGCLGGLGTEGCARQSTAAAPRQRLRAAGL